MFWKSPYVLLIVASFMWGVNPVVAKAIVGDIPPITLALLRWVVALLIFLPFVWKKLWQDRMLYIKNWKMIVLIAISGVTSFNVIIYIAVQYTSAINASLMNSVAPIIIMLLSVLLLKEKLSFLRLIGIIISIFGLLYMITRGSWSAFIEFSFNKGDIWMLLAVLLWGVYSIAIKKASVILPATGLFAVCIIIAVTVLIPASAIEMAFTTSTIHFSLMTISVIVFIGIFPSIVSFTFWNRAVALIGPSRSGGFLNLIPLSSAIFAPFLLGEGIYLYHLLGALFIISGVYIATKAPVESKKIPVRLVKH